ncbi:MAG: protein kinase [Chloroflexi bacterium]|nr:protein kinase [Chloroflexota bacterium]MCC6891983.1 protein kinase [Anaerolineae bacterium]
MPDSLIGQKIGNFQVEERLGQGAMATVYKAFEPSISRYVALKVIRLDEGEHEEFKQRFAREAEFIAKLEHIHILPIYAYGIKDELAYLAMRWLKGGSLSEVLKRGAIPLDRTAVIFSQVAQGLSFAHSKGIIHRDLKPSNIMLDDGGYAYLTDFGLAKLTESSGEITRSGTIVGTPAYMSPEQLRGEPLDHRSDIYSLGVILYNMVAGRLPFDTNTADLISIIYQHLEKPPTSPREFNPNTPPEVEAVIMKALQKDRTARYNTATEMAQALNIAVGLPAGSSTHLQPVHPLNPHAAPKKVKPAYLLLASAVLIILSIVLVVVTRTIDTANTQQATQTALAALPPLDTLIETGKSVLSEEIVPDSEAIIEAKARLSSSGFIAYIACTQETAFHAGMARDLSDLARKKGLRFRLYDSETDSYKQQALFDTARAEGAAAMIVCPLDISLLENGLAKAHEANIPIVFQANDFFGYGAVLVGGDNYLLGLTPGQFAGQLVRDEMGGTAQVIILDYASREDIVARANGLEEGLKEFAPDATVIGRYTGATRELGKESVAKLLEEGIQFNFILSINDAGSFGAIDAMVEAGIKPDEVTIVSIDAEPLAQEYILKDYFIRGSVGSSNEQLAEGMMDAVVNLLAGETIAESIIVPPKEIVTKETLEKGNVVTGTPSPSPQASP